MAEYTNNYNLEKQQANEYISIEGINDNFDIIDAQMKSNEEAASKAQTDLNEHMKDIMKHTVYAVASGTNTYTAAINGITSLVEGMSIKIKFPNANTGASTLNINGLGAKEIRKSNGNALSSGNIKAGQICHLVYTGSVFQLLGEGGEYGTATSDKVLAGYTIGTESGVMEGTMPNNGPAAADTINLTNQNQEYTIAQGYHSGLRKIKAAISGLAANVIKAGTTVGGIVGTFTSDANAAAGHILSGMTAYVNGNKITGNIPSKGAATYTPGTTNQTIAAGQYLSGTQTIIGDANLVAANIKSGISIFGVTGSYQTPVIKSIQRGSYTFDDTTSSVNITISAVDLNAAIVLFSHKYISGITTPYNVLIWARLTSPTTLELARAQAQGQQQVEWQVVEFNNVKSVQRGTVNMNSSATVTINAVDLSKSLCFASFKDSGSGGDMSNAFVAIKFNSTTQLSLSAYATISNTRSVHWQVIEFK